MRGRTALERMMKSQNTVLVVNSNVDVLVFMKGILQNSCRVLVAADAESACRLLTIEGVHVNLAVVDGNVRTCRRGGVVRRMRDILPQLRIIPMECSVEDGVIRIHSGALSRNSTTTSLLQRIHIALTADVSSNTASRRNRPDRGQTRKVMVAGQGID
jgi:DNA-binding NtrC family response regulator